MGIGESLRRSPLQLDRYAESSATLDRIRRSLQLRAGIDQGGANLRLRIAAARASNSMLDHACQGSYLLERSTLERLAIFIRGTRLGQRNLRFAHQVVDRGAQLMSDIG